jgi:hypothetical protein
MYGLRKWSFLKLQRSKESWSGELYLRKGAGEEVTGG